LALTAGQVAGAAVVEAAVELHGFEGLFDDGALLVAGQLACHDEWNAH